MGLVAQTAEPQPLSSPQLAPCRLYSAQLEGLFGLVLNRFREGLSLVLSVHMWLNDNGPSTHCEPTAQTRFQRGDTSDSSRVFGVALPQYKTIGDAR